MLKAIVVLHLIVCFVMIISVLLQAGKGASIGSSFGGGGGSQALFGTSGPTSFLTKITTVCAVIFMCTSLYLTYLSANKEGSSVMSDVETMRTAPPAETAPAPDKAVPIPGEVPGPAEN